MPQISTILPQIRILLADQTVHLNIGGKPAFEAHPVRRGTHKGARIEGHTSLYQAAAKE